MKIQYLIRGITNSGHEVFYTGRSGMRFIGEKREAFTYLDIEGARRMALILNRGTVIHGVGFIVVPNVFSDEQITKLRADFAKIETVSPDRLPEFHAMFDKWNDAILEQIAGADIKFLSKLARNECTRRAQ